MPWIYHQRSGELTGPNGQTYTGYSGAAPNRNNPAAENVQYSGPIPRGTWNIGLTPYHGDGGPYSLRLTPRGHNAHGRTDFVIHGDNSTGTASQGCIIMPRAAREAIVISGDFTLEVRE